MTDAYLITYSGSTDDGFTPVVQAPELGRLLYLTDRDGNSVRHPDPYQAEAHAGHYLCSLLNEHRAFIWLLHISHAHGDDYTAFISEKGARQHLFDYVNENWNESLTGDHGPLANLNPDDAIDAYFAIWAAALHPETYTLHQIALAPGPD